MLSILLYIEYVKYLEEFNLKKIISLVLVFCLLFTTVGAYANPYTYTEEDIETAIDVYESLSPEAKKIHLNQM